MNKFLKINFKYIFYMIIALVFVKPRYFEEFQILDILFNVFRIIFSCVILMEYLIKNKYKVSKYFILWSIFYIILIGTTIWHRTDILRSIMFMLCGLSIISIIEMSIKDKNLYRIDAFYISYFIMVLINFICLVIFPKGLYVQAGDRGCFLNIDNLLGHILLLNIMLATINISNKRFSIISKLNVILCVLTIIITWSATAVVALLVFFILLLLKSSKTLSKIINCNNLLIIYGVFFFILILNGNSSLFNTIITNVLKKDLTFSGRTFVWNEFFNYINNGYINIIIGNGIKVLNTIYVSHFGVNVHLHNQFYNVIYEGGLCALFIFVLIILNSTKKLERTKTNNKTISIITAALFSFLMFMTMEINRDLEYLIFVFTIAYYVEDIIRLLKNTNTA